MTATLAGGAPSVVTGVPLVAMARTAAKCVSVREAQFATPWTATVTALQDTRATTASRVRGAHCGALLRRQTISPACVSSIMCCPLGFSAE